MRAKRNAVLLEIKARLEQNPTILALTVFGSTVQGDVWEQSDIDIMAILEDTEDSIPGAAYLQVDDLTVHLQYLPKSRVRNLLEKPIGPFHNAFGTGEFLLCRDEDTMGLHRLARRPDSSAFDLAIVVSLGRLLESAYRATKSTHLGRTEDAFIAASTVLERWRELSAYLSGQYPGTRSAKRGHDEMHFARALTILFDQARPIEKRIAELTHHMSAFLEANLGAICDALLDNLRDLDAPFTVVDLERLEKYQGLKTNLELVLGFLVEQGVVRKVLVPMSLPGSLASIGNQIMYELLDSEGRTHGSGD